MVLFDRWTSSINDTKRHEEAGAKMLGIKLCKIMHNCINGWDSSTPAMKIVLLKVDNVLLTNYYSRPIISRFTWGELVCGNFSRPSLMHTCFFYIQLYGKYWAVARICSQQWRSRKVRAKISHARIKVSLLLSIFLLLLHHSWAWFLTINDIISLDGYVKI